MAAGANEVQLTITAKVPLTNGRAMYFGTAEGGSSYPTGGATIGEEATNTRAKVPGRWDWMAGAFGLPAYIKEATKLKILAVAASEAAEVELANGKTMATAIPAGTPFWGVGLG